MVYGREDLLGQLGDLLKKRMASLVTCRGRRRIGKSTLVEEFARRTGFPGELKYAWDNLFKRHDRLIMVVCGSVSTWITKNILKSKGFVGRPACSLSDQRQLHAEPCRQPYRQRASLIF